MSIQKLLPFLFFSFFSIQIADAQHNFKSTTSSSSDSIQTGLKSGYPASNNTTLAESIVNYGKLFLNTPYRYGSAGADSFDCSGFTSFVYRNFGYDLQRSSSQQAQQFDTINRDNLKAGDLVFFSGRGHSKRVGHVGIVISAEQDGKFDFIHASCAQGVTISNSDEPYYTKRFIKANRVIGDNTQLASSTRVNLNKYFSNKQLTPQVDNEQPTNKQTAAEYHRVKSGETLTSIAQEYGTSIAELQKYNDLKGSRIHPGLELKVKDVETIQLNEPSKFIAKANEKAAKKDSHKTDLASNEQTSAPLTASNHTVIRGESLYSIAKTYNTSIDELKKINNLHTINLKLGQELKVNDENTFLAEKSDIQPNNNTYRVQSGESLSNIARKNNMSIAELKKINHLQSDKLRLGQELIVNEENNNLAEAKSVIKMNSSTYRVQPGESLSNIARKNNMTLDELKKINHLDNNHIRSGQELAIHQKADSSKSKTELMSAITHKVKSGESYFSIAKIYACTIEDLKDWNGNASTKINVGDKIIIHSKTI